MIFSQDLSTGLDRISKKDVKVCVVGVGTIGLPLATFLAKNGFEVMGLDVSQKRVDEINSGNVVYEYTDVLQELISKKKLLATTDVDIALKECEIIFVCVPTPLNKNNEMDIKN